MRKLSLREIQERDFEMLLAFRDICEANHLYYTLCGGTLLGAVRHKDFIPWDDDVDVMMPRADFEKLLSPENIDTSMLPEHMALINWRTSSEQRSPYIKIIDRRTMVRDQYSFADSHLWIDIFPVDGCPADDAELKRLFKRVLRWRSVLLLKAARPGQGKSLLKRILKPLAILALKPFSSRALCDRYDAIARTYDYDKCDCVGCVTWGYGPQERIDKKGYSTPRLFEFEGEQFTGPSNYHEYLTGLYGDYMTPPPLAQRRTRHELEAYALE